MRVFFVGCNVFFLSVCCAYVCVGEGEEGGGGGGGGVLEGYKKEGER